MNIVDSSQADPTASGEGLYYRHTLRLVGSAGFIQDVRVGSFNTGTGAYLAAVTLATTIFSGMPFEVHGLVPPAEKDRALDAVIRDVRYEQEVALWAVPNSQVYTLPSEVQDVLDVRYFTDPAASLNRGEHAVSWWKQEATASRNELRIDMSLQASQQLVLRALLTPTLGAGDLATVNLPDDDVVLWGATARCYWLLEGQAPGQEVAAYRERRREAAREYTRLSARFAPVVSRKIQLDEPW